MTSVAEHIAVPAGRRDLEWLADALHTAIALEHSTLPLYLAGMYSLPVQNYTTYNALRSVAMEEMAHMASAANILAAIGGRPRIAELAPGFPRHGLPGGAEPDLIARLAPLSRRQLKSFMRIETPAFLLPALGLGGACEVERFPTIASLYGAISAAIEDNAERLRAAIRRGGCANQVGDRIGIATIAPRFGEDPLSHVRAAVAQIIEQGEGSPAGTLLTGADSQGEESHYCRFAELYYGRRYQQPETVDLALSAETEPLFFQGLAIPFPAAINTLTVPADGYAKVLALDPNGTQVEQALVALDSAYTEVMTDLDAAWNGPAEASWSTLGRAVSSMSAMRVLTCFHIVTRQVPPAAVAALGELYPDEHAELASFTDLSRPVFYGPRFINRNSASSADGGTPVNASSAEPPNQPTKKGET